MAISKLSLSFRIFKGDLLVREERLAQTIIKVGKVPSAHLCIDDESVSRMHAIIEVAGADVTIVDLGSTRGTFVNGQKVTKAKLRTGDTLQLGDTRVEVAIAEPALAEVPAAAPVIASAPRPIAVPPALPAALRAARAPSVDEAGGAKAVEVAAMLGDSVVGVKHCMDPRGGKVTRATWAFAAGGLACLLASATAFYASVDNAAENAAARVRHTRELNRPAYSFRPNELSGAVGGVAFGGLALGLSALTLALVRARGERRSPFYRIGTAPGVEQPLEHAPAESFPLVAPSGDDFVFNYGPGIEGELIAGGVTTPLAELAASGRVRPSATTPGAVEVPIPAAARIRARAGQMTFLVSAVARPKRQATPVLAAALEGRVAKYAAGSLAAHLALVMLLYYVPLAEGSAAIDLAVREPHVIRTAGPAPEQQPQQQEEGEQGTGKEGESKETTGMELPSGTAGDPKQSNDQGKLQLKNNDVSPQLAREEAIEAARNMGVLGSVRLRDSISALTSNLDFSSGFDRENQWGALDGLAGAGRGTFGMGVSGDGRGGGCFTPPCGIIGIGNHYLGTIGVGKTAGEGFEFGKSKGTLHGRVALVPIPYPRGVAEGTIDKEIIRRHVKNRQQQISHCYEKELLARSDLAGEVLVQFLISPTGNVQSSVGTGFDGTVAGCVANVIRNIAFPASKNGTPVTVNYPFNFRRAGA